MSRKQDSAEQRAGGNGGAGERPDDHPHYDGEDGEPALQLAQPFVEHVHRVKPEA